MATSRAILRAEAKKLYKEQVKDIPKKQRILFAEFFKKYKNIKSGGTDNPDAQDDQNIEDDFNFDSIINTNEISDDNLEESQSKDENQE